MSEEMLIPTLEQRALIMRAWIQRRRDKGEEPNADAIWERIKFNWPSSLTEEQREWIFQHCEPRKHIQRVRPIVKRR